MYATNTTLLMNAMSFNGSKMMVLIKIRGHRQNWQHILSDWQTFEWLFEWKSHDSDPLLTGDQQFHQMIDWLFKVRGAYRSKLKCWLKRQQCFKELIFDRYRTIGENIKMHQLSHTYIYLTNSSYLELYAYLLELFFSSVSRGFISCIYTTHMPSYSRCEQFFFSFKNSQFCMVAHLLWCSSNFEEYKNDPMMETIVKSFNLMRNHERFYKW